MIKTLHRNLSTKYPWYAKWHAHRHANKVHYGALILTIALVGISLSHSLARTNYGAAATPEAFAEVNGLHLLQEGEYAILTNKGKSSKIVKQTIMIKDGGVMTMDVPEGTNMSVLYYDPSTPTYVPTGASNLSIRSIADFTDFDGKIDTAIERKLKKNSKVGVIIKLKAPYKNFYDKADSDTLRASKNQSFNSAKASVLASAGAANAKDLKIINGIAIEVSAHALAGLQKNPNVESVVLDREAKALLDTSVNEINAPYAWGTIDGNGNLITGTGMRIAVIDTGVDYTHPDLGGCFGPNCKVIDGYDFVNHDADPMDDQGHGTHVAATAAGKGLLNGVAPDAKIIAYKVLNSNGSGNFSDIIAAIDRSADPNGDGNPADHVDVGTMSLGGNCGAYTDGCGPTDLAAQAVNNAVAAGVIYTIAAGNSGPTASTVGTPGAARDAITVAAACKTAQIGTTCANPIANFSSRGPVIYNGIDYKKPDIAAPGVLICAARWATSFSGAPTCFDDHHIRISGTSMATPHMAGVAALMKQANPALTPLQIKDRLKTTATSLAGMTYNDQGAGEVNVQAALPLNSKISETPDLWQVTTDPTKKISTHTQSYSVKASDASIGSVTISPNSPVPGITFTPSKSTLNLANLGSDTFTGTITVDNDTVMAGRYTLTVYFMQNGQKVGGFPVIVTVTPTVTVDRSDLDYGVDDPTLSTWTSATQTITLTNKRTDAAQTLSVAKGTYPSGITLQTNVSSVTIPAGGTATVSSNFVVSNSSLANGVYGGSITFTNAANATRVTTKFTKYYLVTVQNPAGDDIAMLTFALQNSQYGNGDNVNIRGSTASVINAYLNKPGTYNLNVWYNYEAGVTPARFVTKENISVTSGVTNIIVQGSESTNKVLVTPTAFDGSAGQIGFTYYSTEGAIPGSAFGWAYSVSNPFYVSNMSSNYHLYVATGNATATAQRQYMYGGDRVGISGDWNITNTPQDLKQVTVQHYLNLPDGTSIYPNVLACDVPGAWFCFGFNSPVRQLPFPQFFYTSLKLPSFGFHGWADASRGTNYHAYFMLDPFADAGKTIYNNLGPTVWYSGFANNASQIVVRSISGYNYGLKRQDEKSFPIQDATPFTVYKNGSVFASGSLPAYDTLSTGLYQLNTFATFAAPAGAYELRATIPYMDDGVALTGTISAQFDTSKSDPNPPFINYVHVSGNGYRTEVYDPTATHTIEMSLSPDGGSMSSVTLEIAADTGSFTPVSVVNNSGVYTATLPQLTISNKVQLRLKATDSSGNILQYTFELPKGTISAPLDGDKTPPVATLISPVDGAMVNNSMKVEVTASDNVGIAKIELLADSSTTPLDVLTVGPSWVDWLDTHKLTDGAHTFYAKAYDEAGNSAKTNVVNITVSNGTSGVPADWVFCATENQTCTFSGVKDVHYGIPGAFITKTSLISPIGCTNAFFGSDPAYGNVKACYTSDPIADTTAPTTSITAPTSGATISGTATINATATDNVAVDHVDFYRGTTLIGADASAPYSLSWDTTTVANGSYTLSTKAYDAAGNVGTSAGVAVTVSNTVTPPPDTTVPVATMKAPVNGATISGATTLTASATDNVGVTKVSFFRGSTLIDTDTTGSPDFSITWDTTAVANGSYTLTAKAYDAANNVGTSTAITVTVSNGTTPPPGGGDTTAPTVSVTAPADGTTAKPNTAVTVTATASDNVGVTKVGIYVNNSLLCTIANAPYTCTWTTPKAANKTYTLTAKAYDAAGNVATSAPVKVAIKK